MDDKKATVVNTYLQGAPKVSLFVALLLVIATSFPSVASAATSGTTLGVWTPTGAMGHGHAGGMAVLLPSGQVLVTGGTDASGSATASTDLYNSSTGSWSPTGSMTIPRGYQFTATLLGNGKVLVTGGLDSTNAVLSSAELFEPNVGTWTLTGAMSIARFGHNATLLPNGKVLVAGGGISTTGLKTASAEFYDPNTGKWTSTGNMSTVRDEPHATLLPNGKVLAAGGCGPITSYCGSLTSAELYDPSTGTWTLTGSMNTPRAIPAETLLLDGRVLVAGGLESTFVISASELYDPITGTWTNTGSMADARDGFPAILLTNGTVLIAGGCGNGISTTTSTGAEVYTPSTGTWTVTGSMSTSRCDFHGTLLPNGTVLVAGGYDATGKATTSAELYTPTANLTITPAVGPGGTSTTASGSGFAVNHGITFTSGTGGKALNAAPCTTRVDGTFSGCVVLIPLAPNGTFVIKASDGSITGSASYTVTPTLQVTPKSKAVGGTVKAQGTGFKPSTAITFSVNGVAATGASCQTTARGLFTACTFTVPALPPGTYTAVASDGTNVAGSQLTVTP